MMPVTDFGRVAEYERPQGFCGPSMLTKDLSERQGPDFKQIYQRHNNIEEVVEDVMFAAFCDAQNSIRANPFGIWPLTIEATFKEKIFLLWLT
jgi:hypothetical protein